MTAGHNVYIAGTGSYIPEKVLSNHDLAKMVDTSDDWIVQRTGIRERRIAAPDEHPSVMGTRAGMKALEEAGVCAKDVQLIICGTTLPDYFAPNAASRIQVSLDARNAAIFDINAGCTSFVYSLVAGWKFLASGAYDHALVIGTETVSRGLNYKDRNTCILFGDGAGAAVLKRGEGTGGQILFSELGGDGWQGEAIIGPGGGAALPSRLENIRNHEEAFYLQMKGRDVFKFALSKLVELTQRALEQCGCTAKDLGLLVPHQVNLRIIESAAERLGLPMEKIFVNIQKYGNTSAASVPVALDEARKEGRIRKGDLVVLVAFGAGLTWGSVVLRY